VGTAYATESTECELCLSYDVGTHRFEFEPIVARLAMKEKSSNGGQEV